MSVEIRFVEGEIFGEAPGTAKWDSNFSHLRFISPCSCGKGHYVDLPIKPPCPDGWGWDGDKANPTLSPSILNRTGQGCEWHGHLIKGVFIS